MFKRLLKHSTISLAQWFSVRKHVIYSWGATSENQQTDWKRLTMHKQTNKKKVRMGKKTECKNIKSNFKWPYRQRPQPFGFYKFLFILFGISLIFFSLEQIHFRWRCDIFIEDDDDGTELTMIFAFSNMNLSFFKANFSLALWFRLGRFKIQRIITKRLSKHKRCWFSSSKFFFLFQFENDYSIWINKW